MEEREKAYLLQSIGTLYVDVLSRDAFIKELKTIIGNKDQEISNLRTQLQSANGPKPE